MIRNFAALAGDRVEDLVRGLGPDEWAGVLVPGADPAADIAIESMPCCSPISLPSARAAADNTIRKRLANAGTVETVGENRCDIADRDGDSAEARDSFATRTER